MAEMPMVGARVPQNWQKQIEALAKASERKEAEVVQEVTGNDLGKTDAKAIKNTLEHMHLRLTELEWKLSGLGKLIGG